jgi:DNA-binding response OmpR family regulator
MRILIAETDLLFLAAMKQALEQSDHDVTTADDGMKAWDYLTGAVRPHLLVTGLRLGQGSPPGTALGLRAQASHPRVPVIYIPATAELARLAEPAHGLILLRPFAVGELIAAVQAIARTGQGLGPISSSATEMIASSQEMADHHVPAVISHAHPHGRQARGFGTARLLFRCRRSKLRSDNVVPRTD